MDVYLKPTIYGVRDAKLKVERAKAHLDEIELRLEKLIESKPYTVTRKDDRKKNRHIIRVEVKPIDETFGLLIGEFAYNLRSVWTTSHGNWRCLRPTVLEDRLSFRFSA